MTDLPTQISGATWECKRCDGVGFLPDTGPYFHDRQDCPDCKGTGRVDALPGLKEPCPCPSVMEGDNKLAIGQKCPECYESLAGEGYDHSVLCSVCQGRGWVATQDLAVILEATERIDGLELHIGKGSTDWIYYGEEAISKGCETGPVEERTLKAIAQALKASGATLYEEE